MRVTAAGKVGISTAAPAASLHVAEPASGLTARFSNETNQTLDIGTVSGSGAAGSVYLDGPNSGNMEFRIGGAKRMRIDASGNVVIGGNGNAYSSGSTTFTPAGDIANSSLSGVASSVNIGGIGGVSNGFQINTDVNNKHTYNFLNGPDISMKIDNTGQVGIGTTDPSYALDVQKGATTRGRFFNGSQAILIGTWASQPRIETSGGQLSFGTGDSNPIVFKIAGSEAMRVDTSGNIRLGTTDTNLIVNQDRGIYMEAGGSINTFTGSGTCLNLGRSNNGVMLQFWINGGNTSGGISTTQGGMPAFFASSDERLKDNIVDHESELANVMSLRPTRWDWKKEEQGSGEGFIAQELEATAWSDLVAEGEDGFKTVAGLGAVETRLIKAMQEQQAMIEALTAKVEALENA
jgi:hypothetical protein